MSNGMNDNHEFFTALNDLEKERGISRESMLSTIKSALTSACRKQYGSLGDVEIDIDENTETIKYYTVRYVTDEITEPERQISLDDARKIDQSLDIGDSVRTPFAPKDLSRIASQAAKNVIMQYIHESERNATMSEFSQKEGELMVGTIRKTDVKNVYVELGKGQIEGVMPPSDQVPSEKYEPNDTIKVLVRKVRPGSAYKGTQVIVSRSAPGLVGKLFEEEVPEIKQGLIQIKGISREPGARSKVAICATDPRVDAIGACVGNKGSRVNAIVEELHGEKLDIIPWSDNPLEFIARALSPAKVLMVRQLEYEKSAMAIVPDDKLSLAIGKDGQNARLAARLTGWKIDVKSRSAAEELGINVDGDTSVE